MGNMFIKLSKLLDELNPKPEWIIVMGDATTTFVGAVVAVRKGYPVVHIEAGVRSGSLSSIEEMHRRIVSHIAEVHFCTSQNCVENLKLENITQNVFWSGDIAHDFIVDKANNNINLPDIPENGYILVTMHKPINVESPEIITNLISVLSEYQRKSIFVVHPRTKKTLSMLGFDGQINNVNIIEALPYLQMLSAIKRCSFIITDSGGLQREAYYLKKRCLVRRDSVGWTNFIDAGIHHLIAGDQDNIKSGLEWAEKSLLETYPNIDKEFIRKDSWKYALDTLANLSLDLKE
jgi:UDP-N-acetylglucosamine 2-epimerase